MQFKFFAIPATQDNVLEGEMNRFLRSNRVLEVYHEFMEDKAVWCFCVKYMEGDAYKKGPSHHRRVDYKNILSEESFARFVTLRKARKNIAEEDGVPAFVIFTDKQMADLAKLGPPWSENMAKVEGLGKGKVARYAERLTKQLEAFEEENHE